MKKRDLKSNTIAKRGFNKRKGNSNFRALNNYQIDKVPNDNLYKNDNLYSINKNFEFPQNEENTFKLFHYHHFIKDSVKELVILLYLRFFSLRINNLSELFSFSNIFNIKNSIHLVSVVFTYLFTSENYLKSDNFNLYLYYLFSLNQSIHILYLYYTVNLIPLEFFGIISEIIFNMVFIFFLRKKIIVTYFPLFIIICIYLYTSKISIGLLTLFYIIFALVSSAILFMIIVKSIKEIWALYDSFKRSYFNLNQGLLDSDPNPIFIISRDKNLLYKNTAAAKLVTNILENPNPTSPRKIQRNKEDRFSSINFLDMVHPNLRDLFKKLLNDIMEDDNGGTFNFPLCKINNNQNLDVNILNAYDINNEKNYLYYAWYNILVCKTEWKSKTAFYMCLFPSDDIHLNEIYYQYTKRFSEKIEKVIAGSDIISLAFMSKMENKNISSKLSNVSKSDKQEEEEEKQDEAEESKKNEIEPQKKNIYKLLVENANNLDLNNTILFFFKNQVELLYDYSLTLELYFATLYKQRNFKYCYEKNKPNLKNRIKIKDIQEYYSEYFYDFTKEHKYKLEFKNDEEYIYDIYIEENYLRIIMFNIIVFLISYLDDKTEPTIEKRKEIVIKLIPEPVEESSPQSQESNNSNEEHQKYYGKNIKKGKLSFIFESYSLKVDLNKIQELINQRNKNNCHIKAEILKLNYFDIGILTTKYLLENYYKTKLEMLNKEGEQVIQFKIPCDLEMLFDITQPQESLVNNSTNLTSSSFFTSPKLKSRGNIKINKPKNFYNYNQNYNKKVLDIFYGIEKSPLMRPRHMRGVPSLGEINLTKNKQRRFLRFVSHNYNDRKIGSPVHTKKTENPNINRDETKVNYIDNSMNASKEKENNNGARKDKNIISQFSFKKIEFPLDSNISSLKNDKITKIEEENENKTLEESKNKEVIEEENDENNVLIFETPKNKDLISLLNNENKGNYLLKIRKNVEEVVKELKENNGRCIYKILLINMGNIKEIKYAEKVCDKKGDSLIFGYHFGIHTKSREKNNVKYDKRFDLSFSYEGILYALNSSIIK